MSTYKYIFTNLSQILSLKMMAKLCNLHQESLTISMKIFCLYSAQNFTWHFANIYSNQHSNKTLCSEPTHFQLFELVIYLHAISACLLEIYDLFDHVSLDFMIFTLGKHFEQNLWYWFNRFCTNFKTRSNQATFACLP